MQAKKVKIGCQLKIKFISKYEGFIWNFKEALKTDWQMAVYGLHEYSDYCI